MNESLRKVIEDLKANLDSAFFDSNWHLKKLKECEEKIIRLNETICELESMKDESK